MSLDFNDLYQDLSLEKAGQAPEQELLVHITERVEYYLQTDKGLLLSYMYRLDIEERDIEKALTEQEDEPVSVTLARLILNRQKKRVETKKKYGSPPPIEGWEF